MSEEILQNLTERKLLPYKHYEAFGLKMLGFSYDQIALKLDYHPVYVRSLFARSGSLYTFWRTWVEERKRDKVEETLDIMFEHMPDAMRANVIDAKHELSMVAIAARKFIFEYGLGKPMDKLAIKADININTTDLVERVALRRIENAKRRTRESDSGIMGERSP